MSIRVSKAFRVLTPPDTEFRYGVGESLQISPPSEVVLMMGAVAFGNATDAWF